MNDAITRSTALPAQPGARKGRLSTIDALRGLVIVLMALDHSRDFFFDLRIVPEDIETTTLPLYLTRWVTHFCAPTFVFLAGVSAWLYGARRESQRDLQWFLVTRGAWLVFLDFTVIYFGIAFSFTVLPFMFLVISAIGVSMMALSLLCFLPDRLVGALGILIIVGHNSLDGIDAAQLGSLGPMWQLLHDGPAYIPQYNLEIAYPVIPWLGVMLAGYGLGPLMMLPQERRQRIALALGLSLLLAFFVIRSINVYGDPSPWRIHYASEVIPADSASQSDTQRENPRVDGMRTVMAYGKCTKYPPSLAFLTMTMGPSLILLGLFEGLRPGTRWLQWLCVFGRVPLFFYVVHFYVLHASSILAYALIRGEAISPFQAIYRPMHDKPIPELYGFQNLVAVYLVWCAVVAVMFLLCRWFDRVKRNGKHPIWSYL